MYLSVILGENSRSVSIMAELYLPAEAGVVARSGNTSLVLLSDQPALQPGGSDTRLLSFSIRGLYLQNH